MLDNLKFHLQISSCPHLQLNKTSALYKLFKNLDPPYMYNILIKRCFPPDLAFLGLHMCGLPILFSASVSSSHLFLQCFLHLSRIKIKNPPNLHNSVLVASQEHLHLSLLGYCFSQQCQLVGSVTLRSSLSSHFQRVPSSLSSEHQSMRFHPPLKNCFPALPESHCKILSVLIRKS